MDDVEPVGLELQPIGAQGDAAHRVHEILDEDARFHRRKNSAVSTTLKATTRSTPPRAMARSKSPRAVARVMLVVSVRVSPRMFPPTMSAMPSSDTMRPNA